MRVWHLPLEQGVQLGLTERVQDATNPAPGRETL